MKITEIFKINRLTCLKCVLTEQHPIEYAIDGTNRWWQSPSIKNGMEYHYVTITLDLKQVENTHTVGLGRVLKIPNIVHILSLFTYFCCYNCQILSVLL